MLDSRVRGNDAPVVMPVKMGIQSSARDLQLILVLCPLGEAALGNTLCPDWLC